MYWKDLYINMNCFSSSWMSPMKYSFFFLLQFQNEGVSTLQHHFEGISACQRKCESLHCLNMILSPHCLYCFIKSNWRVSISVIKKNTKERGNFTLFFYMITTRWRVCNSSSWPRTAAAWSELISGSFNLHHIRAVWKVRRVCRFQHGFFFFFPFWNHQQPLLQMIPALRVCETAGSESEVSQSF